MNIDKLVFRIAGSLVLVSLALGYWLSPYWLWLTAFVGANMLQASFTGYCPLAKSWRNSRSGRELHSRTAPPDVQPEVSPCWLASEVKTCLKQTCG